MLPTRERDLTGSPSFDNEKLLEQASAAGRTGAWQWDIAGSRASWTRSLHVLLDLDTVAFDGTPDTLTALFHADDRERLRARLREALRTGKGFDDEVRTLWRSGKSEWVRIGVEIQCAGDRAALLTGTVVDIDACKRAEQDRDAKAALFSKMFHLSPLVVTLSCLRTGRLIDVNDAFVRISGYSREEALSRTTLELGLWPCAEDREAFMNAVRDLGSVRNRILHLRARGGEERIALFSAEHVTIDGAPHVLSLFEDITVRERAQAALRESEQRLRLALRAANAGVWQMDLVTGAIFWSDEFRDLYGHDGLATPGRDLWASRLHPEDRERMLNDLRTRLKPGTDEYRREFRILHPTRGLRWILALGQIERNEQGRAISMTGISIDITRIKAVEQELRDADARKNEFLAVLSHELRNPLAPLRNGIEILRLTQGTGEIAEKARMMMARQLEQMVRLIDDLLEVSRVSRGKIDLKRAPIELTAAIQHALEVSKPLIDAAGHDLTIDIPAGPLVVDADITRLAQVFGNLLNNAAKYTNPGGRIRLTVERAGAHVRVSVRDNGIGIPAEKLPRIFEMFAQLDNSQQRTQGGLGIGLSIAKRLVEMHGGTLEGHSSGIGKGSEFVVDLPLLISEPALLSHSVACEPAPERHAALRVLVADDNTDAVASLALVLEMKGHDVRTAYDGAEAVRIAESFDPHVAILDIGMPQLDGYEVCRRLRALPHGRDTLIIALTGWGQTEDKQRSKEAGFDQHLVKPADMIVLEDLILQRPMRKQSQPAG